ncbi:hypothetical protein MTO96_037238 [Rhipicephalus appendiculatus]
MDQARNLYVTFEAERVGASSSSNTQRVQASSRVRGKLRIFALTAIEPRIKAQSLIAHAQACVRDIRTSYAFTGVYRKGTWVNSAKKESTTGESVYIDRCTVLEELALTRSMGTKESTMLGRALGFRQPGLQECGWRGNRKAHSRGPTQFLGTGDCGEPRENLDE